MPHRPPSDAHEPEVGYVDLVRHNRPFRRLWIGNIVSLLGDWFHFIALISLVGGLTGSPLAVGLVFVSKILPWAVVSPLAGVLVDRYDRRTLMVVSDLLRAVVVLGFLFVDEAGDAWLVYALTTLLVVIGSVFQPAKSASIPNITRPAELLTANALMSATWSIMLTVGAGLGGLVTEWIGARPVFVLDAATYVLSAWFIWRIRIPQETEPAQASLLSEARAKIAEGWAHVRRTPRIGRITLVKGAWGLGGGALVFMLALMGEEVTPGYAAAGVGLLFLARGLGTGLGPVLLRAFSPDRRRWPYLVGFCVALAGMLYGSIGVVAWGWWVALLVVAAHVSSGANWVLSSVLLQERTADRYRGRVFATDWLLVMLAQSISTLVAALLLEYEVVGLRTAFLIFGGVMLVCAALWQWLAVPSERRDQAADARAAAEGYAGDGASTRPPATPAASTAESTRA